MKLAIFGAQGYALSAYEAIKVLYPKRKVSCFLVSEKRNNMSMLDNIPVKEIAIFSDEMTIEEKRNIEILIATPENQQYEIEEALENYGFCYYRRLDSDYWAELMKMYHIKLDCFQPLSVLPIGYHTPFVRIYMAKSQKDKPLKNSVVLPDYILPLYVGTKKYNDTFDIADSKGENISYKNGNYSELTGLYWIWKNKLSIYGLSESDERQYFGLAQYRRELLLSSDDLLRLVDNEVDVVLPYPMLYEPNIHVHHERYLKEADWKALLIALQELQPDYAKIFPDILGQRYFYNYNVILAKKMVLAEYCEWLFPILKRIEELSVPRGEEREDRYIGYMAESLETLYFLKNLDRLNIVHTECKFYV